MKKITILGATGSIGTQTLDVISKSDDLFEINALTTNKNINLLEDQIKKYNPKSVVISDEKSYKLFKKNTSFKGIILSSVEGLNEVAADTSNDLVVSSLVGFAGVEPTLAAIEQGIDIGLANKETLVAAGDLITKSAKKYNSTLLPIDSEHSAIFQCLQGEEKSSIKEIILTASGGPFFMKPEVDFNDVTVADALNHPNWSMGSKVTIDSATMMNKGFEVIEAYWLFGIASEQIKVFVHPQSIVHSLVRFNDTSLKAQLGSPDMRMPISYALNYPNRLNYDLKELAIEDMARLEFFEPNFKRFPCLKIAFDALEKGGIAPVVLNAANEVAVAEFLNENIKFSAIPNLINETMNTIKSYNITSLDDIIAVDSEAKNIAYKLALAL